MNVIVSNKQKNLLDNANIDAIKDLNGLFNVDDLINNFKDYFFSRMVVDATSIIDFAKKDNLEKLIRGIGAEKIILFLPERPEPPIKFKELLLSLGVYNFSTRIEDIVSFLRTPNTFENAKNMVYGESKKEDTNYYNKDIVDNNKVDSFQNSFDTSQVIDKNKDRKIVIGFKNVTNHAGSTTLIYILKNHLEKNFNILVDAIEVSSNDFQYFNSQNMISVSSNNIDDAIKNSNKNVILIDLKNSNYESLCDDVVYLLEPSIIKVNSLLSENSGILTTLRDKKVVLNKSALSREDSDIFGREAGLKIYYNLPFVNDRLNNIDVINDFIKVLNIANNDNHIFLNIFK